MTLRRRHDSLAVFLLSGCSSNARGAAFVVNCGSTGGVRPTSDHPSRKGVGAGQSLSPAISRGSREAQDGHIDHVFCTSLAAGLGATAVAAAQNSRRRARREQQGRPCNVYMLAAESPVILDVKGVLAKTTDSAQKVILNGLDLTIREGEVHAVMGLNGSGKSTLAKVLIGDSAYEVTAGHAMLGGQSLFDLEPHQRALAGLFLAFQSPPAISGVSNLDFLRASYNAKMRATGKGELDVIEFYGLVTAKLEALKINADFLNRNVNEGFSGGERKRNEMLQMSVLEPKLAILDEIDSGLDIDALKDVADAISRVRGTDGTRSLLVVTHFERFLKYVDADYVHVMHQGRIVKSGGRELSQKLDAQGYDWIIQGSESG